MKKVSLIVSAVVMTAMMLSFSGSGASTEEVTIGKQVWMTKNLNVDKFRNGDPIPEAKTVEEWVEAGRNKQPAWCFSNNDPSNGEKYGKLYNFYAVNDPRGLAPKGYHIPTLDEWKTLMNFLKSNKQIKLTNLEETQTSDGKKHCGFDVKLSGIIDGVRHLPFYYGINECGKSSFWWSSTLFFLDEMKSKTGKGLRAEGIKMFGSNDQMINMIEETWKGMSVRCIKNK